MDAITYMPRYMTNTYARTRIADIYYDYLNDETKANIEKRDEMIQNLTLSYDNESSRWWQRGLLFSRIDRMIDTPNPNQDIRADITELQRNADIRTETWYDERIEEGWEFADRFSWGIPPVYDAEQ
jgi:hypothetical protein